MRVVMDPQAELSLEESVHQFVDHITGLVADDARRYVPVRTGFLRSTIQATTIGGTGQVVVTAWYWSFLEYGHEQVTFGNRTGRWTPAKPFMRPALYTVRLPR